METSAITQNTITILGLTIPTVLFSAVVTGLAAFLGVWISQFAQGRRDTRADKRNIRKAQYERVRECYLGLLKEFDDLTRRCEQHYPVPAGLLDTVSDIVADWALRLELETDAKANKAVEIAQTLLEELEFFVVNNVDSCDSSDYSVDTAKLNESRKLLRTTARQHLKELEKAI